MFPRKADRNWLSFYSSDWSCTFFDKISMRVTLLITLFDFPEVTLKDFFQVSENKICL